METGIKFREQQYATDGQLVLHESIPTDTLSDE